MKRERVEGRDGGSRHRGKERVEREKKRGTRSPGARAFNEFIPNAFFAFTFIERKAEIKK